VIRPLGHGPSYSGKFIARAVELYLQGVKPGYIRWHELQSTLEKEFPTEFDVKGEDRPSPETIMEWVRKYPDAPERLKQLRVQEVAPDQKVSGMPPYPFIQRPRPLVPVPYAGVTSTDINAMFSHFIALMAVAIMARFAWSLARA
jgi:hypothetical protein